MAPRLDLPDDVAHLWIALAEDARDPALCRDYLALLTEEERARHDRHQIDRHRHEFLLTRALCRTVLSRYAGVDPRAWRFSANAHGRPEIEGPERGLSFNLSNTRGLVACLVARDREIGVDVEDQERPSADLHVADRFFSPSEVADLYALPEAEQRARFFAYWTLKEAYIKARGMGLALPLRHFSFSSVDAPSAPHAGSGPAIAIAFDPALDDDPESWQFSRMRPTERHFLATAIRRRGGPDLTITTRRVVPLREG